MKKLLVFVFIMVVALTPLSFANMVCDAVDSPEYIKAFAGKFFRGLGNAALCWVELFRQPMINENKWEGIGRGIVMTGVRGVAGALEAATSWIPGVQIPQPDPACPTDLVST